MRPFVLSFLLCAALFSTESKVCARQEVPPPASPSFVAGMNLLLDGVRHDPARSGPLIAVDLPYGWRRPPAAGGSLDGLAESLGLRVVRTVGVSVLAPRTMRVIVDRPGRADPFAALRPEERFKVLLSKLSAQQWQAAGSARGIGAGEMDDEQRALFLGLLPEKVVIQVTKLVPADRPDTRNYEPQGEPQTFDPGDVRLRLSRKVQFRFSKLGADDYTYSYGTRQPSNELFATLQDSRSRGDAVDEPGVARAFGVVVARPVASRLKPGDIDFAASTLDVPVALDGGDDIKTLGDLLARVARAANLDLVADRRVAKLALLVRAAPQQSARAGDVLEALCWSVTGTFRRVGASTTFLLTDDREGIATRWARIAEWGEAAESARYKTMAGLNDVIAKNDPLSSLGFAPGDPLALTDAQTKRIDTEYRKTRYNDAPEFTPGELPAPVQKEIETFVQNQSERGVALRADRVQVGATLKVEFTLPGDLAVEPFFAQNFDHQFLQAVAVVGDGPPQPATRNGVKPAPARPLPASLARRVLVAPLPGDPSDTAKLFASARDKGFTDVWLHVSLADAALAARRLASAVLAGKRGGIRVGVAVSLLKNGGMPGPDDVNIFGETGAQFAARRSAQQPEMADFYRRAVGWIVPDLAGASHRLAPLVRVEGLSALAIRATAAPGWAGDRGGGDGIPLNGHLGYTNAARLACVRAEGLDPIDVVSDYFWPIRLVEMSLPFFPAGYSSGLWKSLADFRLRENTRVLAGLYANLRRAAPSLPLYLTDRASDYADPHTKWYALWGGPERIPANPIFAVDSEGKAAAFASSSEPLLLRQGWVGKPDDLARAVQRTTDRAVKERWRGAVLDLATLTPADAFRTVANLPDAVTATRPASPKTRGRRD